MTGAHDYDVVVVGGGSAGVAAAVAASREGARTLLIEQAGCLGGAAATRNVLTYCGLYTIEERPRLAVAGIAAEVVAKLRRLGAVHGPMKFRGVFLVIDPEGVKRALDEICLEAGIDVLLHSVVTGAGRAGDRVAAVTVRDCGGAHVVTARAFVDASGDGDLAALAGAAVRYGNHGAVNLGTLGTRFGGIAPDADVSADAWSAAIRDARARGVGPLSKDRSVIVRLPLSGDCVAYLASEDYDPRDAASITRAEMHGRMQAWAYLDAIRTLPGHANAYLASSGPNFGTRESRHIDALTQVTQQDVATGARCDDAIALGAWGMEWHDRTTFESSFASVGGGGTYDIPLRCLISADTPNLLATGRMADGDQYGGASLRVMGTAFATGQAAGVAAAQFVATDEYDPSAIRATLRRQGALTSPADIGPPVSLA